MLFAGSELFIIEAGVPRFRVSSEDGTVEKVRGDVDPGRVARSELAGSHVVVFADRVPRALLDTERAELLPIEAIGSVSPAETTVASERYIVGLDGRDWPVFRIDVSSREMVAYAVSEPSAPVELTGRQRRPTASSSIPLR